MYLFLKSREQKGEIDRDTLTHSLWAKKQIKCDKFHLLQNKHKSYWNAQFTVNAGKKNIFSNKLAVKTLIKHHLREYGN